MLHNIPEIQPEWLREYISKLILQLERSDYQGMGDTLHYVSALLNELAEESMLLNAFMAAALETKLIRHRLFALKYVRDSLEEGNLKVLRVKEEVLMDQGVGWLEMVKLCREICEEG